MREEPALDLPYCGLGSGLVVEEGVEKRGLFDKFVKSVGNVLTKTKWIAKAPAKPEFTGCLTTCESVLARSRRSQS